MIRTMERDWELLLKEPYDAGDSAKARDVITSWCKTSRRKEHDEAVAKRVYRRLFGEEFVSEAEEFAALRKKEAARTRIRRAPDETGV